MVDNDRRRKYRNLLTCINHIKQFSSEVCKQINRREQCVHNIYKINIEKITDNILQSKFFKKHMYVCIKFAYHQI